MEGKKKVTKQDIKKERSDSKTNRSKVAVAVLKSPLKSQSELAKDAGVSVGTVNAKLNELEWSKNKDIIEICDKDKENVMLWQKELNKRLKEQASDMSTGEIVQVMSEGTKRYVIFKGDVTDSEWGMKSNIFDVPTEQLLERLNKLNGKKD